MLRVAIIATCLLSGGCYGTLATRSGGPAAGWPLFGAVRADAWMVGEGGQRQDALFRGVVWASLPLDCVFDVVLAPVDVLAGLAGFERRHTPPSVEPKVITEEESLEAFVGQHVTLRGPLQTGKGCRVLGVNVRTERSELRGQLVEATGLLVKHDFSESGDAFESNQMPVGGYSLYDLHESGRRARVRAVAAK